MGRSKPIKFCSAQERKFGSKRISKKYFLDWQGIGIPIDLPDTKLWPERKEKWQVLIRFVSAFKAETTKKDSLKNSL
jgi:hypothetical protein